MKALKNSISGSRFLPAYRRHITKSIFSFDDGRLGFIVKLEGRPFETVGTQTLDNEFNFLNDLFLDLGRSYASRLSAWFHLDHHKAKKPKKSELEFSFEWLKDFSQRYMTRFENKDYYENTFYVTVILKNKADSDIDEHIRELEEIQMALLKALVDYQISLLGLYEIEGNLFSESYDFLAYLYNGFWSKTPITSAPMFESITSSTLHFGYKLIERRFPHGGRQFSLACDMKEFPSVTRQGRLNNILSLRFPFVLCFSFTFLSVSGAIKRINQAENILESANDEATTQAEELETAKDHLRSGELCFGGLHGALIVHGSTERETEDRGSEICTILSTNCSTVFIPSTLSAPESFLSIFPGNTKNRPRVLPKTTRNLLSLFSLNCYLKGKAELNPLGDGSSILPLETSNNGIYHLNFHPTPVGVDRRGKKDPGHLLIQGSTGVGKTTAQTVFLVHTDRFDCDLFGIDKEGSMRGMILALGGVYYTLKNQEPTGLAPFQLPPTPETLSFLYDLVEACGRRKDKELTSEDRLDIKNAVDSVMALDISLRRFGALLHSIPDRGEDCLARRLAEWCHTETGSGRFAYALDNPSNTFDFDSLRRIGFDVTDFLRPDHPATEPILSTLLHIKSLMKNSGRLMATVIEEYWLPMSYPTTRKQIEDGLRTGRRRLEFLVLVSQLAKDALASPLSDEITSLIPTKMFLSDPEAVYKTESGGGFHCLLSKTEFDIMKRFPKFSRKILIKQKGITNSPDGESCVAVLNLDGFEEDIAVLAMAQDDFPTLEQAIQEKGNHPDQWVPYYKQLWKAKQPQSRIPL